MTVETEGQMADCRLFLEAGHVARGVKIAADQCIVFIGKGGAPLVRDVSPGTWDVDLLALAGCEMPLPAILGVIPKAHGFAFASMTADQAAAVLEQAVAAAKRKMN